MILPEISETNEQRLIDRIRAGERNALAELIDLHGRRVYRQAWAILRNGTDAEDIFQETFLRAFRFAASFRGKSLRAWLARITVNCCMDFLAGRKKQESAVSEYARQKKIETVAESPVDMPLLTDLLELIPEKEREIVAMRFAADLSYGEISELTGMAEGSLRNIVSRAIKTLRQELVCK